jgi:serine/threonine-protein kinase
MELLDGVSFAELVASAGPTPAGRAAHLVAQAARAVGEAHRAGIVHRDIKPENLLISRAGGEPDFVKVIDFGIARSLGDANVTAIGEVAGTPSYMAPETADGAAADARSDVYALGGVLYHLLTGAPPFAAESASALIYAHRHEPVVVPSLRAPAPIGDDLERIVLTCLAKSPAERFADGAALADALARTAAFAAWHPGQAELIVPAARSHDPGSPTVVSR